MKNPCFMVFLLVHMACGVRPASSARITIPPTHRLGLMQKGIHWQQYVIVAAQYHRINGIHPMGGLAALNVNIFKGLICKRQ
jgi:hypothetical protein